MRKKNDYQTPTAEIVTIQTAQMIAVSAVQSGEPNLPAGAKNGGSFDDENWD